MKLAVPRTVTGPAPGGVPSAAVLQRRRQLEAALAERRAHATELEAELESRLQALADKASAASAAAATAAAQETSRRWEAQLHALADDLRSKVEHVAALRATEHQMEAELRHRMYQDDSLLPGLQFAIAELRRALGRPDRPAGSYVFGATSGSAASGTPCSGRFVISPSVASAQHFSALGGCDGDGADSLLRAPGASRGTWSWPVGLSGSLAVACSGPSRRSSPDAVGPGSGRRAASSPPSPPRDVGGGGAGLAGGYDAPSPSAVPAPLAFAAFRSRSCNVGGVCGSGRCGALSPSALAQASSVARGGIATPERGRLSPLVVSELAGQQQGSSERGGAQLAEHRPLSRESSADRWRGGPVASGGGPLSPRSGTRGALGSRSLAPGPYVHVAVPRTPLAELVVGDHRQETSAGSCGCSGRMPSVMVRLGLAAEPAAASGRGRGRGIVSEGGEDGGAPKLDLSDDSLGNTGWRSGALTWPSSRPVAASPCFLLPSPTKSQKAMPPRLAIATAGLSGRWRALPPPTPVTPLPEAPALLSDRAPSPTLAPPLAVPPAALRSSSADSLASTVAVPQGVLSGSPGRDIQFVPAQDGGVHR